MFKDAIRRNGVACRGCGFVVDERDVVWNDDCPSTPYCSDCAEDNEQKGDDDELN